MTNISNQYNGISSDMTGLNNLMSGLQIVISVVTTYKQGGIAGTGLLNG